MTHNCAEDQLRHALRDIVPPNRDAVSPELGVILRVADRLPLPYMVQAAIALGTNCKFEMRPREKTAWSVDLCYRGAPFRLEYGKFGMRLLAAKDASTVIVDELIQTLDRSFPLADNVLHATAHDQVKAGEVTVANRHALLRGRYDFLCELASQAFATPRPKLDLNRLYNDERPARGTPLTVDFAKPEREGFFFGSAAIDAYFSWLEHILVLVLPFLRFDPTDGKLVEFAVRSWSEKLKIVWDIKSDNHAKVLYDRLREIKETFRNSFAHGLFEKRGASFYAHIPGLGAVPTALSRFTESIHFDLFPLKTAEFSEARALFDSADSHLRSGRTRHGMQFLDCGLDVAFDCQSRQRYVQAMQSDCEFDEFLEHETHRSLSCMNMEW